jgi:hypothetical protein
MEDQEIDVKDGTTIEPLPTKELLAEKEKS